MAGAKHTIGMVTEKPKGTRITLLNGKNKIIFPITPESYEVTDTWQNEELNINKLGLITMIGKRGLKSLTISSFFPKRNYNFIQLGSTAETSPWTAIKKLQSWRGKVLTLSISGTKGRVSWQCVIDGDFTYGERDASGDVYFNLTLKEYKKTKTKRAVKKPTKKKPGHSWAETFYNFTYPTQKKGETVNTICRKYYGDTKKRKAIYKLNKTTLEKAFKKYMKKLSKEEKKKYKKKSKYNKPLPKKTKIEIRGDNWL